MNTSEKAFFDRYLKKIKLEDKDYFNYGVKGYKCKKTILTSDRACLKKCEELLKKMDAIGEAYFIDPDFGP